MSSSTTEPEWGRVSTRKSRTVSRLLPEYRASEPHGWPAGPEQERGATIGGHVVSRTFTQNGTSYRIGLLAFGESADDPDPLYEPRPFDPHIAFDRTLNEDFGDHYSFRYAGGLRGTETFRVRSYSVYVNEHPEMGTLSYGADLYVVYQPYSSDKYPRGSGVFRWIRVIRRTGHPHSPGSFVDNVGGVHPFSATGGRTSIFGEQAVNVAYLDGVERFPAGPDGERVEPEQFVAEVFLATNRGVKDSSGKEIVYVLGGFKYGWQVKEIP